MFVHLISYKIIEGIKVGIQQEVHETTFIRRTLEIEDEVGNWDQEEGGIQENNLAWKNADVDHVSVTERTIGWGRWQTELGKRSRYDPLSIDITIVLLCLSMVIKHVHVCTLKAIYVVLDLSLGPEGEEERDHAALHCLAWHDRPRWHKYSAWLSLRCKYSPGIL